MHGPTFCNKDPPVLSLQCHNKTFNVDEAMNQRTYTTIDEKTVVKKQYTQNQRLRNTNPFKDRG